MRITYPAAAAALLIGVSAQAAPTNLPAQQSTITWSRTKQVNSYFSNYARATSTVIYDPATNTYTIRDTGNTSAKSTFGPSGTTSGNFTTYSKGPDETFRVLNQGAVGLTYVDFGQWRRLVSSGATKNLNITYLIWGNKTPVGAVPTSGTGTYNTIYDGSFVDKTAAHDLNGTGTIMADFGAGSIHYTAGINGVPSGPLAFSGDGVISSTNGFTTSNSSTGYTLTQYGNFYGPQFEEVGGLFRLTGGNGNGQGAFAGHQ